MSCFFISVYFLFKNMTEEKAFLSLMLISIVLASTIVTLGGFGVFGVAHGQSNATTTSSSLTEQQRAAMCDPSNPKLDFVNSTESKACGLPKSVKSNISNTTTAGPEAPSAALTPPEPGS
jgi:hypothetical protein